MLKRLYSKSAPRASISGEIKKEFSRYFATGQAALRAFCARFPLQVFLVMVFCLGLSCLFSVRPGIGPGARPVNKPAARGAFRTEFSQLLGAARRLKKLTVLKAQVDSLCRKQSLSGSDSALLKDDLAQLQQIQKPLKLSK